MKRIYLLIPLIVSAVLWNGCDEELMWPGKSPSRAPKSLVHKFDSLYPNAQSITWSKSWVYGVNFNNDSTNTSITFYNNGKIGITSHKENFTKIPSRIRERFDSIVPNAINLYWNMDCVNGDTIIEARFYVKNGIHTISTVAFNWPSLAICFMCVYVYHMPQKMSDYLTKNYPPMVDFGDAKETYMSGKFVYGIPFANNTDNKWLVFDTAGNYMRAERWASDTYSPSPSSLNLKKLMPGKSSFKFK